MCAVPPLSSAVKTFEGHETWVQRVAWYPDGRRIVSGSWDGELLIWDTQTGLQVGKAIKAHGTPLLALDVSLDGTTIASGGEDRTVRLWNSATGDLIHTCQGHKGEVRDVHFSPDSKRVASCSSDQMLRVWDAETGKLALEPVKCKDAVSAIRYSPYGDRIASGAKNIQIWDVADSVILITTIKQLALSLGWTYDGEHIVAGGLDTVTIWDASSGEQIRTWEVYADWIRVSLSPTTASLTTCSWNARQTLVFDIDTGEQIAAYEHDEDVICAAYSPSGKFITTACYDKKLYLWEAPQKSRSPGSSILNLPATISDGQIHDQVIEQLPQSNLFDVQSDRQLPPTFRPSLSGQPTGRRHRGTLRGALDGIVRHRGGFHPPQGNWVAESRARPIMTFQTGPLPDEVERGCLFQLASYICYGRRDPNIAVPGHNAPADMPPSTSEATARHSRGAESYPPASMATTAPAVPHVTSPSAAVRVVFDRLSTFLTSCIPNNSQSTSGATIAGPLVPTIVVTNPSPGSANEPSESTVAQQASSLLPLSTTPTGLKPICNSYELPHNNTVTSQSASGQPSSLPVTGDVSTPLPTTHNPDSALQPTLSPDLLNTVTSTPPHDAPRVSALAPAMGTQQSSLGINAASSALSFDEVAVLQGYRWYKENLSIPASHSTSP